MASESHKTTLAQKPGRINFEVDPEFKRQVDIALATKQMSIRQAGCLAFSKLLDIPLPVSATSAEVTAVA